MPGKSYAWALLGDPNRSGGLSAEAREGLEYARRLAQDARERSYLALREPLPPPLTPEDLAVSADVSAATIRRRIKQARLELFGPLGTSGIYARQARARVLQERPAETCAAPECERPLPYDRTRRRRFCSTRCRVRAHRERCRDGSRSAA